MKYNKETSLIYFGHNRNDVAVVRRIISFMDAGIEVVGLTFRRDGDLNENVEKWRNIDLGYIEHIGTISLSKLFSRLINLIKTVMVIVKYRKIIKATTIIYARNLDMFLLAWFAKILVPFSKKIMVYECLDVHDVLTGNNLSSRLLRWLERRVLNRCDLLVVSSPGFIENYFEPVQKYTGNCFLVENKLHIDISEIMRPQAREAAVMEDRPIRLVWAGILRCQKTLDVLKELAKEMGKDIDIRFWGKISTFLIPDFEKQIQDIPNITYYGPYSWPAGLAKVYRDADLAWSQELSWGGHNSDWLIPNRIYEASYFGVLSLAVKGTQTAKAVKNKKIGYVLEDAKPNNIISFIRHMEREEIYAKRISLLTKLATDFVSSSEETLNFVEAMKVCRIERIHNCRLNG